MGEFSTLKLDSSPKRLSEAKMNPRLTAKEKAFIEHYLRTGDEVASYKAAYVNCSEKTAKSAPYTVLKRKTVQEYMKANNISSNPLDYRPKVILPNPDDILSVVGDILNNPECRPADRLKAAELAGRYWALWKDRQLVEQKAQVVILDDLPTE